MSDRDKASQQLAQQLYSRSLVDLADAWAAAHAALEDVGFEDIEDGAYVVDGMDVVHDMYDRIVQYYDLDAGTDADTLTRDYLWTMVDDGLDP